MENTMIMVSVGAVAIIALFFIIKSLKTDNFETITQDSLSMKEVVTFFKGQEIFRELENNSNLKAVAIRKNINSGNIKITLALFDKTNDKIANTKHGKTYIVKNLDSDLEKAFGNKEMIVLQWHYYKLL